MGEEHFGVLASLTSVDGSIVIAKNKIEAPKILAGVTAVGWSLLIRRNDFSNEFGTFEVLPELASLCEKAAQVGTSGGVVDRACGLRIRDNPGYKSIDGFNKLRTLKGRCGSSRTRISRV